MSFIATLKSLGARLMAKKVVVLTVVLLAIAVTAAGVWGVKSGKIDFKSWLLKPESQRVAKTTLDYVNKNLLQAGTTATLSKITLEGSVYKIDLAINGQNATVYVSRDAKFLFPAVFEMAGVKENASPEPSGEITKSEKPDVKLFVMSYCPYGLQAERAYLPVYDLLKSKADLGIYFVDYILHGKQELDENLRQYCLQKQDKDLYAKYLACFFKAGKADDCLAEVKADKKALQNCVSQTDLQFKITAGFTDESTWLNGQYPKFNIYSDLNAQYGVKGSPTIVINGKQVALNNRSAEAFKNLVCQAFLNQPAECSQTLSNDAAATGFGEGSTSGSGGNCAQ